MGTKYIIEIEDDEFIQNEMNDLISRQAAIDALKRAEALTRAFGYHNVIETIRELPTAQPELTDEEKRLIKKLRSYHNGSYAKVIDKLLAVASAQPDRSLWFRIGEICVDESKGFISAGRAVEKIRELLREVERMEECTI